MRSLQLRLCEKNMGGSKADGQACDRRRRSEISFRRLPRMTCSASQSSSKTWSAPLFLQHNFYNTVLLCGALIAAFLSIGYHLGVQSTQHPSSPPSDRGIEVQETESDSEGEDEELADGDLSAIKPGFMEQCKLVSSSFMALA